MSDEVFEWVDLLIVGGGFAGLGAASAAAEVRSRAGGAARIVVVNGNEWLTLRPRLYEADLSGVQVSLPEVLDPLGVELVVGTVSRLDATGRTAVVVSEGVERVLAFDHVVLAAGSRLRAPALAGSSDALHNVDTYEDAVAMQRHVEAVAQSDRPLDERFGAVVVGAGLAGLETATELAGTLSKLAADAGHPAAARVVLVDPAPSLGALHGAAPADVLASALAATRVELVLGRRVTAVSDIGAVLDDGAVVAAGTVVWTAGLEPSPLVADVAAEVDRLGRLVVDDFLSVPGRPGLFAAGDVAAARLDDTHTTVMSCQHAIPTGKAAGRNAMASLLGLGLESFRADPYVTCIDLGAAGALLTTGWERTPVATGAEGKAIKRKILDVIHPLRWDEAPSSR